MKTGAVASLQCSQHHGRLLVSLKKSKMAATPTRKRLTLANGLTKSEKKHKICGLVLRLSCLLGQSVNSFYNRKSKANKQKI